MPMSPDLLAAVGNITIGKEIAPHHRSSLLPDGHCNPLNGLTKNHRTSVRTFKVLDALASLAVSCKEGQVVAVGLQLVTDPNLSRNTITITLADNEGVTSETVEYVSKIWKLLQELASIYATERADRAQIGLEGWTDWTGLSPPVPCGLIPADQVIARLARHVYSFTDKKFRRRVNRWWARLRSFTNDLSRSKGYSLTETESQLRECVLDFKLGLQALEARRIDWPCVVDMMDSAALAASTLLANAYSLESLVHERQSDFPLRRALEKLTSHHRHFTQLIGSASSPRLHRIFSLAPTIVAVPDCFDEIPRYSLPDTRTAWRDILAHICADQAELMEDQPSMSTASEKLHEKLAGVDQVPCVHCECALAAHYERNRGNGNEAPPFSYIGVSKLSCMPCHLWLRALAAATGRNYYTRGSHGKWYRGWRAPSLVLGRWSVGDTAGLEGLMKEVLVERLLVTRGVRSGSDSTDASGCTVYAVSADKAKAKQERVKASQGSDI